MKRKKANRRKILKDANKNMYQVFVGFLVMFMIFKPVFPLHGTYAQEASADSSQSASDSSIGSNSAETQEPPTETVVIDTGDSAAIVVVDNDVNENQADVTINPPPATSTDPIIDSPESTTTTPTSTEPVIADSDQNATSTSPISDQDNATSTPPVTENTDTQNDSLSLPPMCVASTSQENSPADASANESSADSTDSGTATTTVAVTNNNESAVCSTINGKNSTGANGADNNNANIDIDTGNALTEVDVDTTQNLNETRIHDNCSGGMDCSSTSTATSTQTLILNNNAASTTNAIETDTVTGKNSSQNNTGNTDINTGDIMSFANVSNFVNTNVTGDGEIIAADVYGNVSGDLDISGQYGGGGLFSSESVVNNSMSINNNNISSVDNTISSNSFSGSNTATENGGNVNIETGDILSLVNIANIVNTNIYGNQWYYILLNIFGNWAGSIILPNAEQLMREAQGAQGVENQFSSVNVSNENTAELENNVNLSASSGENQSLANGGATQIETGNVASLVKIVNELNTNIFNNFWDLIKINIFGLWSGSVFGLPENASYMTTSDGIIVYFDRSGAGSENPLRIDGSGEISSGNGLSIENNNSVSVANNVELTANSGSNIAEGNSGNVKIKTGNVRAGVNIANILNTNIVGNHWNYAVINVFGSWNGSLEFGRPNLWVKESISHENETVPVNTTITYTIEFGNSGDGTATNISILHDYPEDFLITQDIGLGENLGDALRFNVGSLGVGETKSFTFTAVVNPNIAWGEFTAKNPVNITARENDRNLADNSSNASFIISHPEPPRGSGGVSIASANQGPGQTTQPNSITQVSFEVVKTNNAKGAVMPGDKISYKIVVFNEANVSASSVQVKDELKDASGNIVATNNWELGEVLDREEVTIDYDVVLFKDVKAGVYTNTAYVRGWDKGKNDWAYGEAKSSITVEVKEEIKVQEEQAPIVSLPISNPKLPVKIKKAKIAREIITNSLESDTATSTLPMGVVLGASHIGELAYDYSFAQNFMFAATGIFGPLILLFFIFKKKRDDEEDLMLEKQARTASLKKFLIVFKKFQKSASNILKMFFKFIIVIKIILFK